MARSRVTGAKETAAHFRKLAAAVGPLPASANEASTYALRPMLAEAKRNVPRRTGLLRKALGIKRDRRSPKLKPVHLIGPLAKFKGVFRYAHLTEFGKVNRDGSRTPGTHWLTRAFEATREEAVRRFGERFGQALEKRAARARSRR